MPLYSNADVDIMRFSGCREGSTISRFINEERGPHHVEADLFVSERLTRAEGNVHLSAGQVYNDYSVMAVHYCPTLVLRPNEANSFSSISLMLYTVDPNQDLSERSDAVYVWRKDASSVKVLSGGGYSLGYRHSDNIILSVACLYRRVIAIQRDRSLSTLQPGDLLYIVTSQGVEEIVLSDRNTKIAMIENRISPDVVKWKRI